MQESLKSLKAGLLKYICTFNQTFKEHMHLTSLNTIPPSTT